MVAPSSLSTAPVTCVAVDGPLVPPLLPVPAVAAPLLPLGGLMNSPGSLHADGGDLIISSLLPAP